MRITVTVLTALLIPVIAHAEMVLVFQADFNSDSLGAHPDEALPGDPIGDALGTSSNPPGTYTVVESAGGLADQPVQLDRNDGPGGFNMQFIPADGYGDSKRWRIEWCTSVLTVIPAKFFPLRGPQGAIFAMLEFRGSAINLRAAEGDLTVGSWTLGEPNCFEWHLDLEALKQSLYIDGELVADDVGMKSTFGTEVLWFAYEASNQISFSFAMDNIRLWAEETETPTEPTSWGTVKSIYR